VGVSGGLTWGEVRSGGPFWLDCTHRGYLHIRGVGRYVRSSDEGKKELLEAKSPSTLPLQD